MTAETLTPFESFAKRLGFRQGETTETDMGDYGFKAMEDNKNIILSVDLSIASMPPKIIPIGNIKALKRLIGKEEQEDEKDIQKNVISKTEVTKSKSDLSKEELFRLTKITHEYIYGDTKALTPGDEQQINSALFPMKVAAYSYEDYTVATGDVLTLAKGAVVNYGTLTVQSGGQIKVIGNATINCQVFIQEPINAGDEGFKTITCTTESQIDPPQATSGTPGDAGGPGGAGANGTATYNGSNCVWSCSTQPSDGTPGVQGNQGNPGTDGIDGIKAPFFTVYTNKIVGPISIVASGQKGQDGGIGGQGGSGGPGGPAGTSPTQPSGVKIKASYPCGDASAGPIGLKGVGGTGGIGGRGGDGAQVFIYYRDKENLSLNVSAEQIPGGTGGQGGPPGAEGSDAGQSGTNGTDGEAGIDAAVFISKINRTV